MFLFFVSYPTVQAGIGEDLENAREKWEQLAIDDYSFTLTNPRSAPVKLVIEENQFVDISYDCSQENTSVLETFCNENPEGGLFRTVESLFQIVEDAISQTQPDVMTVEYDQTYGYPTTIFIDYRIHVSDDEVTFKASDLKPGKQNQFKIITSTANINHKWQPVSIGSSRSVLFYPPPSNVGAQRGITRIRRGATTGTEIRFQEWSNLDGRHVDEHVGLIAISKGRWQFGKNELEVGTTHISGTEQWHTVNFSKSFEHAPQVIVALQTANGGDAVSLRVRNITSKSMQIQLVEEDSKKFSGHVDEIAGYLLITSPSASFKVDSAITVELLSNERLFRINHNWQTITPGYKLRLEEDQTVDSETVHLNEHVHLIKIDDIYLSQLVSDNGNDNAVLRSSPWLDRIVAEKEIQINKMVADKSCDNNQQCMEIGFGAKPCGGFSSYLIYSTRQIYLPQHTDDAFHNETVLRSSVFVYNELQNNQNQTSSVVSDCRVVTPSFPVCSNNLCVPGD
jgi:hypothetical protein